MIINKKIGLNLLLSTVFLFVVNSCATYNLTVREMYGEYVQKENETIRLELNESSFVLKDVDKQEHLPTFKCCDTIAYGKWTIDKKASLIEINSPETLNSSYVDVNVVEEQEPSLDSISFVINNPIEKHYKKFGEKYREVFYSITLTTHDDFLIDTSDKNPLWVKKVNGLNEFEITIYPKHDIPIRQISIREVYTIPYQIKNPNANVFIVDIPQLDYGYLSYRRLNRDYIKIINKNKLFWDGNEYLKE